MLFIGSSSLSNECCIVARLVMFVPNITSCYGTKYYSNTFVERVSRTVNRSKYDSLVSFYSVLNY